MLESATHFSLVVILRSHCISNSSELLLWWWIVSVVWLTDERLLASFPAGTIVRDPHHLESPTHCEQDLNLRRTRVQALLNEVCIIEPLHHGATDLITLEVKDWEGFTWFENYDELLVKLEEPHFLTRKALVRWMCPSHFINVLSQIIT